MLGLIGQKVGMTQIFDENGNVVPVTVIISGPCTVTDIKTVEKDGYNALQLGFGEKKEKRTLKPVLGQFKKNNLKTPQVVREFRMDDVSAYKIGQQIDLSVFDNDKFVDVQGVTKGKGFQGVRRRYHFKGGRDTHGSNFHRRPGSIGNNTFPGHVWKNKKMPGRMGGDIRTARNLKIVNLIKDENIMLLRGAIPGKNQSIVSIKKRKS